MRNKKLIIAARVSLFVTLLCFSCASSAGKIDQKDINQIVADIREIDKEASEKGYNSAKRGVEAALDNIDHPGLVKALKNIPKETLGGYLFLALLASYSGNETYALDARNAAKLLSKIYPEYKDLPADVEEKIAAAKNRRENRRLVQRQPDRQQPDRQQPDRQQPDRQQPDRQQPDRQQPEQEQQPQARQYDTESDFIVSKQSGGKSIVITGYAGTKRAVIIPSTIQGLPVTGIMGRAFIRNTGLTGVTIPDSVTSIGEGAFRLCTGLKSVNIPDSVTSIGDMAFEDCTDLTGITIGNGVTSIGNMTFSGCIEMTGVTIPDSVTSVRTPLLSSTLWYSLLL